MTLKIIVALAVLAVVVIALVIISNSWDRHQFNKTNLPIEGTIIEFKPVATSDPPGTGPEATVRLDDGRTVNLTFPSFQKPLVANQRISLWLNTSNNSVSPR